MARIAVPGVNTFLGEAIARNKLSRKRTRLCLLADFDREVDREWGGNGRKPA
jgi:hypothetical protein